MLSFFSSAPAAATELDIKSMSAKAVHEALSTAGLLPLPATTCTYALVEVAPPAAAGEPCTLTFEARLAAVKLPAAAARDVGDRAR